jgi:cytochrome oxidase Cu insertion factor (SCO1/SenC/PrrC family)
MLMRALLMLLALAILVAIVLVFTGVLSLRQTQSAQAPKFDLSVKQVEVGTTTKNVQVPAMEMKTKQVEVPSISVGGNQASGQ